MSKFISYGCGLSLDFLPEFHPIIKKYGESPDFRESQKFYNKFNSDFYLYCYDKTLFIRIMNRGSIGRHWVNFFECPICNEYNMKCYSMSHYVQNSQHVSLSDVFMRLPDELQEYLLFNLEKI